MTTSRPSQWSPGTRVSLVLLDLDGTLSDSAPGIVASMKHAFVHHRLPLPGDEVLAGFVGPPFATALAGLGYDEAQAREIVQTYRADYSAGRLFENALYPGILEALKVLRDGGIDLAVATSKPQETARRICEHFGLTAVIGGGERIFGSDADRVGETKGDVIARALVGVGAAAGPQVVMVGDRLHDVEGARVNGLATIGVTWGYAADGELVDAGAAALVQSPQELVHLVLSPG